MKKAGLWICAFLVAASFPCLGETGEGDKQPIRLGTTTSISNSGLMDILMPAFEASAPYALVVDAYGTGRTIRNARDGLHDVIIVHSPAAEMNFIRSGYGGDRHFLMKNQFVIVGPESDPAGVSKESSVVEALARIYDSESVFVSRGDDSGTHQKELSLWQSADIMPYGRWYYEYGMGMGKTLDFADAKQAYTLVDKGTWLAKRKNLKLKELFTRDDLLDNPYHIISINSIKLPHVNTHGADVFIQWLMSEKAQELIKNYQVDGEALFTVQEK